MLSRTRSGSAPASPSWIRPMALMIWPVVRDERFLHRVKPAALREALDGQYVCPVMADREREARIDASAVDDDCARAALAAVATLFGSGQVQPFAKKIEKRDARIIERDGSRDTVDGKRDRKAHAVLHNSGR